ncbi:hypothetical protein RHGRI_018328 [Rhododendron griersonianum]|uniref:Peptide N-acetyl-beta-D-glucosaminyl asparaginase amidase A N-terminal domain-containing protein n=1 Tax=Rhododendron griersonianum TaxID=479676 RepID=A0AAV6K0Z7_9ERIC|nr:hypothetical protein RHGRI_018328 [Rhododendron griersonianum]
MSSSSPSLLHFSLFFLLLLHQPLSTSLTLPKSTLFRPNLIFEPTPSTTDTPITTYFEVTKPIKLPHTKSCSYLLLRHDFAYTYSKPPVLANYTPPSDCPSQDFAKIVLEWTATSKGRQFDRIFGVWLGGVELLRSCTAEPRSTGTIWTVQKDITRYYSLLMTNQTLAVYLGNLVDSTYTGVYHVDISVHFYPAAVGLSNGEANLGNSADLILPVSRNLPLNDGLWFEIENSTDVESKKFEIPRNAYRALLEVYVSFHENDESWYTNLLNEYISANNLTGTAGNGAFREVVVRLDGTLVGAVWPFTVIYTGGVNPLLWRPITGIGSFNLPSYDIEITPFLGSIVDGKIHEFAFSVTNALNVWYIDANLHVWLDKTGMETEGQLLSHTSLEPIISLVSNFTGLNGNILISSSRSVSSIGWVKSSLGNITTNVTQTFNFSNFMVMGNHGNLQIVNQIIDFNNSVHALMPTSTHSIESFKRFLLYLYSNSVDQGNDTFNVVTNLTLGFSEDRVEAAGFGFLVSSLKNLQNAQGIMLVKGNLVVSGIGSTQQAYQYDGSKFCYFRTIIVGAAASPVCRRRLLLWRGGVVVLCGWAEVVGFLFRCVAGTGLMALRSSLRHGDRFGGGSGAVAAVVDRRTGSRLDSDPDHVIQIADVFTVDMQELIQSIVSESDNNKVEFAPATRSWALNLERRHVPGVTHFLLVVNFTTCTLWSKCTCSRTLNSCRKLKNKRASGRRNSLLCTISTSGDAN